MTRLAPLRQVAEYLYLTFPIRRLLLITLVVLSVVPGTLIFVLPIGIREAFAYIYVGVLSVSAFCMYGAYRGAVVMTVGSMIFGRKHVPQRFSPLGLAELIKKMGITKDVEVYSTSNTWVKGPFTNGFTSKIYIPMSWINRFPPKEILATIAHELGHVKTGRRFGLEVLSVVVTVLFTTYALGFRTIALVAEVFELALALLLLTLVSWRNERRADLQGAAATGPEGLISVFEQLKAESKRDDGSETHPPLSDRIARLSKLLDQGGGYDEPSEAHPSFEARLRRLAAVPRTRLPSFFRLPTSWVGRVFDTNWTVNTTSSGRYGDNGVTHHVLDYAKATQSRALTVIDVGSSFGVAAKGMKAGLAVSGIGANVTGVDPSKKVRNAAMRNLDKFDPRDILNVDVKDLPMADVVICMFVALWVGPERRFKIIHRCAEQLKDDGILVTNALPFPQVKYFTGMDQIRYRVESLPAMSEGWKSFREELVRRKEALVRRQSVPIRGRTAALSYAEGVLQSWANLTSLGKTQWYLRLFMNSPGSNTVRLLKSAFR
jgi:2-polyprenyl-3-methyl-5-hydroxy-6-metoxy-1,4-benzoquinol methylase